MANDDRRYGFSPKGQLLRQQPYDADASEGTGIFIGDVMMMESDGNVAPATAASIVKLGSSNVYNAASTVSVQSNPIMINDHPDQLYMAQDDGGGTVAQTEIGRICDHVATHAGSTTTLLSGHELGFGSLGTSNGGFKLLDIVNREDNDNEADNADWVCQLNVGEGLLTVAGGV
jgi:hypothetical protein